MNAAEARTLKVGDWVRASFGCHAKASEILSIEWPRFTLKAYDYRGDEMIRVRNYRSLWHRCDPNRPNTLPEDKLPDWLSMPQI